MLNSIGFNGAVRDMTKVKEPRAVNVVLVQLRSEFWKIFSDYNFTGRIPGEIVALKNIQPNQKYRTRGFNWSVTELIIKLIPNIDQMSSVSSPLNPWFVCSNIEENVKLHLTFRTMNHNYHWFYMTLYYLIYL